MKDSNLVPPQIERISFTKQLNVEEVHGQKYGHWEESHTPKVFPISHASLNQRKNSIKPKIDN